MIPRPGAAKAVVPRVNAILARHTGKPVDRIVQDTDRNYWMTAEEAVNYGVVDEVLTSGKPKV